MDQREQFMGMMALLAEMSGEKNVIEKQEASEQARVVRKHLVARVFSSPIRGWGRSPAIRH